MSDRISLSEGIYTIPEAARLVRTPQPKVRGWIAGYPNTKARPLLENQIGYADGKLAIGFQNLLEVRFVKLFSSFGVSVKALRAMLDEAKKVLNHPHPFSTDAVFKTDGRKIFLETAKTTDDKALYDLQAKNWTMHDVIKQSLLNDVEFDATSGDPLAWYPRSNDAPNVIIRPNWSFGKPVLQRSRIPTQVIFDAFQAEGETEESVAHWFDIPLEDVHESVRFETLLKTAA